MMKVLLLKGRSQVDDEGPVIEGYGLQPVREPRKICGPLGPEGAILSFVNNLVESAANWKPASKPYTPCTA
jgi:hypothetical protein